MAKAKTKLKSSEPKTLEEQYMRIATWEYPPLDDGADLSQPNFEIRHERIDTFVTYGVPPGL